jgi:hypothetical protein
MLLVMLIVVGALVITPALNTAVVAGLTTNIDVVLKLPSNDLNDKVFVDVGVSIDESDVVEVKGTDDVVVAAKVCSERACALKL